MVKIGICIPFKSKVSLYWAVNLSNILTNTQYPVEVLASKHYSLDKARNDLVLSAINSNCTHVLFLDTDIIPNLYVNGNYIPFPSFINHLVEFDYPIVSGIYYSKKGHLAIYEYQEGELPFKPTDKKFEDYAEKVSYVDGIPMGLCLIKIEVFDKLKENGYFPWFEYSRIYKENGFIEISEDLDFCLKIIKLFGRKSILLWGYLVGLHEASVLIYPDSKMQANIFGEY
ncbi:MAG: hypothetical protein QXS74_09785 [Nitrososphaeria archaeon]